MDAPDLCRAAAVIIPDRVGRMVTKSPTRLRPGLRRDRWWRQLTGAGCSSVVPCGAGEIHDGTGPGRTESSFAKGSFPTASIHTLASTHPPALSSVATHRHQTKIRAGSRRDRWRADRRSLRRRVANPRAREGHPWGSAPGSGGARMGATFAPTSTHTSCWCLPIREP